MNRTNNMISHLNPPTVNVDTSNEIIEFEPEDFTQQKPTKYQQCISDIQDIFNNGYSPDNGDRLINYIQKQRSLLIEIMVQNFTEKPNPKMADAMNTLLAQMEKSVRDDRKEENRAKELETSKETFELFSKSLNAVINGKITIPTFGSQSLLLDPLDAVIPKEEAKLKPGEFVMGHQHIDIAPIEAQLEANATNHIGEELL